MTLFLAPLLISYHSFDLFCSFFPYFILILSAFYLFADGIIFILFFQDLYLAFLLVYYILEPATGRTGTWVPGLGMRDIQAGVVTLTTPPQEKPEESNSALQIEKTRTGPLTTTFPSSLEMYYGLVSLLLD